MKKKLLYCFCAFIMLVSLFPNNVIAKGEETSPDVYITSEIERGDVIVTKYRMHNGNLQYRHWNETRNCWVEDHWIDA